MFLIEVISSEQVNCKAHEYSSVTSVKYKSIISANIHHLPYCSALWNNII